MVYSISAAGYAFSLISWLYTSQSGHKIILSYQIKAEYPSYQMVSFILLLVKNFKIYVLNRTKIVSAFVFKP